MPSQKHLVSAGQYIRQRKLANDFLNPQNRPLIPPGSLLFALCHSVRSTATVNSFFTLKTMFLLLLRPSRILILFFSTQSSEWWFGGKPSPRRRRVRSFPPLHLWHCLGLRHQFSLIFSLTAPNGYSGGSTMNSPWLITPPCVLVQNHPTPPQIFFPPSRNTPKLTLRALFLALFLLFFSYISPK
jgi:hypothetical protein